MAEISAGNFIAFQLKLRAERAELKMILRLEEKG